MQQSPLARLSGIFLAISLLAGCDVTQQLKENFDQSGMVIADLKQKTGAYATMGFNTINGELVNVNVTFATVPEKYSMDALAKIVNKSTIKHFKQEPKTIVIGFVIE